MKQHHVFYDYDYQDTGGIGFVSFDTEQDALVFINNTMKTNNTNIENFTYIVGDIQKLKSVEVVTKVIVDK